MAEVPIKPDALAWAIEESGYSVEALTEELDLSQGTVKAWLRGVQKPNVTEFRKLATKLKRPTAVFFLPSPPKADPKDVQFRHPPGSEGRPLNPKEKLKLRETRRLQRGLSWVLSELNDSPLQLPRFKHDTTEPDVAAKKARELLGISVETQLKWKDESHALLGWRLAFEDLGVGVLLLSLGEDSARGFSIWDDRAPLIALNTHWNTPARIYTLFHELGHLLTRTSSLCQEEVGSHKHGADPVERWCESFAASALLPWASVEEYLRTKAKWDGSSQVTLQTAGKLARKFKVSVRAAALRLISNGLAGWDLYRSIPKVSDSKGSGGGGTGRDRCKIRLDEYGTRTARVLLRGVQGDVLTRDDVLGYLNVGEDDLQQIVAEVTA